MEWICPECTGTLVSLDGASAQCTTHGGSYRVLFSHWQPPPAPPPEAPPALAPGAMCRQHSSVPAAFVCRHCGMPVCNVCAFAQPDGVTLCPECVTRSIASPPLTAHATGVGHVAQMAAAPPAALPAGVRCVQHPTVTATAQCRNCGAFMCATCDFALPGGLHVCPACAMSPKRSLSPRRKGLLIGSYALAVWSTLGLAVLLSGALAEMGRSKEGEAMLGVLTSLFLLIPSVIGLALGLSASERRMANGPAIWAAIIWNGLILGGFLLLCVVGIFSK